MTRNISAALVCTAMLLTGAASAGNLVTNPSFDTDASGWFLLDTASYRYSHRADMGSTLAGGSGPGCLEVDLMTYGGAWGGSYQSGMTVQAGTEYTLEASVYLPAENNSATGAVLMVQLSKANGQPAGYKMIEQSPTPGAWTRFTGTITAPAEAARAEVKIGVRPPNSSTETRPAVALFDDVFFGSGTDTTVTTSLFVPAAAAVHGAAGTYWSTNGWISNLSGSTVSIRGAFLRQGQDNTSAVGSPMVLGSVPPRGFTKVDDLVTALGGSEVTGGIYLAATATGDPLPAELVTVTTHTFTPNPYGDGVYGQGIPAVPAGTLAKATVPGVFQSSDLRTNVGALNTSSSTITVSVKVYDSAGTQKASASWTLQPYEQRQVSLPTLGVSQLEGGLVVFNSGSTSYRGYTSTVDQNSGDAVYNEAR